MEVIQCIFQSNLIFYFLLRLCNEVSSKQLTSKATQGPEGVRVSSRSPLKRDLVSHPLLQGTFKFSLLHVCYKYTYIDIL